MEEVGTGTSEFANTLSEKCAERQVQFSVCPLCRILTSEFLNFYMSVE